ncbi:unnamed protein product [Fusarium langsethiae]|nr:unnamed protein product [Fusarium langsethiae]
MSSLKIHSHKTIPIQPYAIQKTTSKCDYTGCNKAFRRIEHLRRHKKTFHGERLRLFSCEFCGKDQFNRNDNLQTHRKLHARPKNHNRGVGFLPAAVSVIEQEELARKRRAPARSEGEPKHQG